MARSRSHVVAVLGVLGVLAATVPAHADLTFELVGDPVDTESWDQAFIVSSTVPFTNLGLGLVDLGGTEAPMFEAAVWDLSFADNPSGWAEAWVSPDWLGTRASGDSAVELTWATHFAGTRADQAFNLTLWAFNDALQFQTATAEWNGSVWAFDTQPQMTWEQYVERGGTAGIAPVPASALLALLGLGFVGARRLRRG